MAPKLLFLAIAIGAALGLPIQASGTHQVPWHWHWGYNYVGADVNSNVSSGFNYWDDQYMNVSSRAGNGATQIGWQKPNGAYCSDWVGTTGAIYRQTPDCGYGGAYIYNWVLHGYGNTAYLYVDSYNWG